MDSPLNEAHGPLIEAGDAFWHQVSNARQRLVQALSAADLHANGLQPTVPSPHPTPIPAPMWAVLTPLWGDEALANRDGRIEYCAIQVTDQPPVLASRDHGYSDAVLVEEARARLESGQSSTATEAARMVADRAEGGATFDSKVRRIQRRLTRC